MAEPIHTGGCWASRAAFPLVETCLAAAHTTAEPRLVTTFAAHDCDTRDVLRERPLSRADRASGISPTAHEGTSVLVSALFDTSGLRPAAEPPGGQPENDFLPTNRTDTRMWEKV